MCSVYKYCRRFSFSCNGAEVIGPVMIYMYSIELLVPDILTELNIYVAPALNSIPA